MKILHTSDWHLGQKLTGRDRDEEHRLALDWLADFIGQEKVDVLVVAGDVFDIHNPPNSARELYYRFLRKLIQSRVRHVVIIGGGVVGMNATKMAVGLGARVTVLDRSVERLRYLSNIFGNSITTRYSSQSILKEVCQNADMVIGAVLIPGASAPKLISRAFLSKMKPGSVLVDVAIDQGGCFETSKATTHDDPTYIVDNVVHYCVANMPGSVPLTSSEALNNATLPHVLVLADKGLSALDQDPHLMNGLNVRDGKITYQAVIDALGE